MRENVRIDWFNWFRGTEVGAKAEICIRALIGDKTGNDEMLDKHYFSVSVKSDDLNSTIFINSVLVHEQEHKVPLDELKEYGLQLLAEEIGRWFYQLFQKSEQISYPS